MSELTRQEPGGVAVQPQAVEMSLESLAMQMATNPAFDADKMVAVLRELRQARADQKKEQFFEALARVQKAAPRIRKDGLMDRGQGKGQIAYAKREDIDAVMRPIYQAEGFSVTWDYPRSESLIRVIGRFTAFGHTEEREWSCSPDTSGGKQNPQAAGSTASYGQRYISIAFWDIITEGADTNGQRPEDVESITQDQADDIRTRVNDLKQSAPGAMMRRLCEKYGVAKPEELRKSQYEQVIRDVEKAENIEAKR